MSQERLIKLACGTCKRINYWSSKNKKLVTKKSSLKNIANGAESRLSIKRLRSNFNFVFSLIYLILR